VGSGSSRARVSRTPRVTCQCGPTTHRDGPVRFRVKEVLRHLLLPPRGAARKGPGMTSRTPDTWHEHRLAAAALRGDSPGRCRWRKRTSTTPPPQDARSSGWTVSLAQSTRGAPSVLIWRYPGYFAAQALKRRCARARGFRPVCGHSPPTRSPLAPLTASRALS